MLRLIFGNLLSRIIAFIYFYKTRSSHEYKITSDDALSIVLSVGRAVRFVALLLTQTAHMNYAPHEFGFPFCFDDIQLVPGLPGWALLRGRDISESSAAFAAILSWKRRQHWSDTLSGSGRSNFSHP
ncbi:hypothetical protein [Neorhizobium sp. T6_25]|uniref:hypothetical protein n=1 Tax=Neorhizobium sp. T6_25 TaxID=2093833 RepID=UPI000CF99C0F|nr:hypothetical protein [Neorhizobium sp. T6_25]